MAIKNTSLAVKLKAIDNMSGPLKNVSGAAGKVIDSLKKTQERLKAVDAETDQFNAFRQLRLQSKETTKSLNQAQAEVQQLAVRMKESSAPIKLLKKDLGAAERQVAELAQEMKQSKQPSDLLTYQFKEAQKEANRLGKAFRKAERDNKSLSKAFEQGKGQVNKLQQSHQQETQKLQQMRQALNKAGVSTNNLSSAQARAKQETGKLNQQYDKQAKKLERIAQIENKLARSKNRLQKSMQISSNMTVAGFGLQQTGKGIQNALGGPTKVAAEFQERMTGVGAVANASNEDLQKLTATARKLGAETSYSASESADGMKYLAMAGFKTNQIIATMPGLLNLAKAGATDLGAASDISSDILSGFGLQPEQMRRVSDVLTATFTTANTNLTMLGETMKYVSPVARTAGMSLEQTAAMAGLLGNVGIKSSQAGTTLRSMVTRLAAPSRKAAKTLQSLGVETKDASGNMRDMVEVIGDMASATDGMGSADKLQALTNVFGKEPAAGMAELLSQEGTAGITKYLDVVSNSKGKASQVADKMSDNAKGKVKELSSAAESLQITLGNALLPTVKSVAIWLANVTRRVDKWSAAHPRLVQVITITVGAIGVLATVCGPLLLAFASFNSMMAMTRYGMAKFSATSRLTAIRMGLVTAAQWAMNASMLANPILLIVLAVVALIAVLGVLIYKYFEPLKALLGGFWDGFTAALAPLSDALAPLIEMLSPIWTFIKWIGGGISSLASGFMSLLAPVNKTAAELDDLRSTGEKVGEFIGKAFELILSPIKLAAKAVGWFSDAWNSLFGDDDVEKTARIKQINESQSEVTQPKVAAAQVSAANRVTSSEIDAPASVVAASQTRATNKISAPKAIAAAGMLAASTIALPVAAEPVKLSPTYQETVAAHQVSAGFSNSQVTIPSVAKAISPVQSVSPSITIGQLDINVQGTQGMDAQEIAVEVRRQFMQLMHEQQASNRGNLYDA